MEGSDSDITRINPLQLLNAIRVKKTIPTRASAFSSGGGLLEPLPLNTGTGWCVVAPCTRNISDGKGIRETCLDKMANVQDTDDAEQIKGTSGVVPECVTVWVVNMDWHHHVVG